MNKYDQHDYDQYLTRSNGLTFGKKKIRNKLNLTEAILLIFKIFTRLKHFKMPLYIKVPQAW